MIKNNSLFEKLKHATSQSSGIRIQRFKRAPIKLSLSKMLEIIALLSGKSIEVKTTTFWKEDMLVVIPELVSLCIYRYGFFEEGLTNIMLKYLKPGMTFFDVGAHFGYFTLLGSVLVGKEGQVHSFEPTPYSFKILKYNASSKKNIFLNNIALFSDKKTISINDYGIRYAAFNSLYEARLSKDIITKLRPKKYKINTILLDEYVKNNALKPNFIKIDAENSEYEILNGMEKTIDIFHPILSIEAGDMNIKGVPKSKKIIDFLIDRDYQPYEFREGKIFQCNPKNEEYQYGNILFLPNI